jgi:hypothetical protein
MDGGRQTAAGRQPVRLQRLDFQDGQISRLVWMNPVTESGYPIGNYSALHQNRLGCHCEERSLRRSNPQAIKLA